VNIIKTIKSGMRWVTRAAHMQQIKINTQIWSENLKVDLCIDRVNYSNECYRNRMSVETVSIIQQSSNRLSEHNKHSGSVRGEDFLEQSITVLMDFAPCC
jgi:hypothetical protein